jgi:Asp-tRNA(Asn)/Glu-tRNA(Gln) amidotransferase A subunit family amidase
LTRWYLDRIARYDREGPSLQAVVNVNDHAIEHARELDRHLATTGSLKGPLHGVPMLVKDQAETSFAITTFGTRAYKNYRPTRDAFVVQRLREAGAIILAKSSMCDFAAGWFSFSSVTERTRNPYDTGRDAGGSSAGTGAGIAANLALVGIGEDTGGSIRIPSSFNNLFGLRVTTGLVSRTGFSPLLHFQDTPGPMARTVRDLARVLDVIVAHDEADPYTAATAMAAEAGRYEALLQARPIAGLRIGILREACACDDPTTPAVVGAMSDLVARMREAGATFVDVSIPDLDDWTARTSLYVEQSRSDLNRFMGSRPGQAPRDFARLYADRDFHPLNDLFHNLAESRDEPDPAGSYWRNRIAQFEFQRRILGLMASHRLDFLMYPDVRVLPPTYADLESEKWTCLSFPTNTVIASQSHLPAISVPAGFADGGVPVGVEFVARPYAEAALLQVAHAIEQLTGPRRPPPSAP